MLRKLMAWSSTVTDVLRFSGPLMAGLVLWQARRRSVLSVCPAFFWYTGFQIAKSAVLLALPTNSKEYFVAYWMGELVDAILIVTVLYRLYASLFSGYQGLRALQDALFRWATAACILIAVLVAASIRGNEPSRLMAGVFAFDVGSAILKAGLVVFVLAVSTALSLRWSQYAFAILVGIALYASVDLAAAAVRLQIGAAASQAFTLIKPAAYACTLLLWNWYFFSKEREHLPITFVPDNDLASWNQALLQLIAK